MNHEQSESTDLCDRCLKVLVGGRGEFYEVEIYAKVDASPPILDAPTVFNRETMDQQWGRLIEQLESTPQVDAENQVHCRRRILLCGQCFAVWIENPAGGK